MKSIDVVRNLSASLVLVFGLVSCSSDKQDSVAPVPDNWPKPELVVIKKDYSGSRKIQDLDDELNSTDTLEFAFPDRKSASSVETLRVKSECSTLADQELKKEAVAFKSEYVINKRSSFRIVDSFSDSLILNSESRIRCNLLITISNVNGSTKVFEVNRLFINRKNEDEVRLVKDYEPVKTTETITAQMFDQISMAANQERGQFKLVCDNYLSEWAVENIQTARLSQLALQIYRPANNETDPRRTHPLQSCQIIFRGPAPSRAVSKSETFRINFGAHEIEVKVARVLTDLASSRQPDNQMLNLILRNPNPYPVSIRVPGRTVLGSASLVFTNFREPTLRYFKSRPEPMTLRPKRLAVTSPNLVLTLKPGETLSQPLFATFGAAKCIEMTGVASVGSPFTIVMLGELVGGLVSFSGPRPIEISVGAEPVSQESDFRSVGKVAAAPDALTLFHKWNTRAPVGGKSTIQFVELANSGCRLAFPSRR